MLTRVLAYFRYYIYALDYPIIRSCFWFESNRATAQLKVLITSTGDKERNAMKTRTSSTVSELN
jgi:hypothetical protein